MTGCQNRLVGLAQELRVEWENTKAAWHDAKSAEFEKRFLDELFAGVNQAASNIETLERVLDRIHDECDPAADGR